MDIKKTQDAGTLTIALTGRLDTTTAPSLEAAVTESIEGTTSLVFDFAGLEYVSSAGLRVLLSAQKEMNRRGSMVIRNVCSEIREVFDITGFADILTVE